MKSKKKKKKTLTSQDLFAENGFLPSKHSTYRSSNYQPGSEEKNYYFVFNLASNESNTRILCGYQCVKIFSENVLFGENGLM